MHRINHEARILPDLLWRERIMVRWCTTVRTSITAGTRPPREARARRPWHGEAFAPRRSRRYLGDAERAQAGMDRVNSDVPQRAGPFGGMNLRLALLTVTVTCW
jgi:hypothetical protein